jgi:hypothetical protein
VELELFPVFVHPLLVATAGVIPNMRVVVLVPGNQTVFATWAVPIMTQNVAEVVVVKFNVVGPIVVRAIPALLVVVIVTLILTVYRV